MLVLEVDVFIVSSLNVPLMTHKPNHNKSVTVRNTASVLVSVREQIVRFWGFPERFLKLDFAIQSLSLLTVQLRLSV